MMERSFSPILRKVAARVVAKPKPTLTLPSEICLEDWWLSKPADGEGIGVSGRPIETRKCDDARTSFNLRSPKRRHPTREFHSTKVVKRHGATMLETIDGCLIFLCGLINKSCTQHNGFTSEVCRDFIYGFPFNWDDYTTQSADEESKVNDGFLSSFTPDFFDPFNGAQLHDFALSLTDTEKDILSDRIIGNSMLIPRAEKRKMSVDASTLSPKAEKMKVSVDISSEKVPDPRRRSKRIKNR